MGGFDVSSSRDFALTRYDSAGTLDTSFGSGGKGTIDFDGRNIAFDLALQPEGKL